MTESNRTDADVRSASKRKIACFLIPVLTAVILLYQVLSDLRIAVFHGPTLVIIGITLAIAVVAGVIAAFAPSVVRVGVLALCALVFLDVTFHLPGFFNRLRPQGRRHMNRDSKRIADIHRIKAALDQYVAKVGPLPSPADYGEAAGVPSFWQNWWDISSNDGDGNKMPFLDFLVHDGILASVPVDPVNTGSADGDPRAGKQYVYFVVPADYEYAGGTCDQQPNRWHYLIGITDLEQETSRPPKMVRGSGCDCFWKDQPNYFQHQFDYVLCGSFIATPESRARAAEARAKRAAAEMAAKERAMAVHVPQDQRRVADLLRIQQGLQKYIREIGPLPEPREYGELDKGKSGFWKGYWDVSAVDGDADGTPFLDFLVDTGTMPSVPVDPDNEPAPDGGPRGGQQYVYMVASPSEVYEGGTCDSAKDQWVYMLGITDLRSEVTRPPKRIQGSGCDCLWKNQPNWFQQQFDYVVCGTFESTPASRARATQVHAAKVEATRAEKLAAARRVYEPQDKRRVADILRIQQALKTYIGKVGSLPAPRDYGESEHTRLTGFFRGYWDVSGEDGDLDGRPFLDFLVESGTMTSVPVDPENKRADNGDPRGGRQYVFFVASPEEPYGGGTCGTAKKEWVYLLGITDLQSEPTRPPTNIQGSGCECLWRNQPDYFQTHFDYVTCGTFKQPAKKTRTR